MRIRHLWTDPGPCGDSSLRARAMSTTGRFFAGLAVLLWVGCSPPPAGSEKGGSGPQLILDAHEMKVAAAEMLTISDTLDRHRRMVELMDAMSPENLPGAIAAYEANLSRVDPHEIRLFTNAWAQIDPRGALDRILDHWRYPKINNQAVLEVVTLWVNSGDSEAARAYVDPSFDGPIPSRRSPTKFMVLAVLEALAVAGEYDGLTQMFGSLEDDADRELFITQVMIEMNRSGGDGSIKGWLDSIPWDAPKGLKFSTLKRGLDWVAKLSGPTAALWYEEIESQPGAVELLPMAVKAWGVRDPGASILWLEDRQLTVIRTKLVREIGRGWLVRRPAVAEAWLASRLDVPIVQRDLLLVLANHYAGLRRFEEAAELARQSPDGTRRRRALVALLRKWSSFDDEAVEAYLEEGNVSQAVIESYRKKMAENPIKVRRRRANPADDG